MKFNLPFVSQSTAELVRKSIKNQQYWLEQLYPLEHVETDNGTVVPLHNLSTLQCFGDDERVQMPFPSGQLSALDEAIKAHCAVHQEIEDEHPEIWAFWGESASGDADAELAALAEALRALSDSGHTEIGSQGVAALGRMSNLSDPSTYVDDRDSEHVVYRLILKAGDKQIGVNLERFALEPTRLIATQGDPAEMAEILEGFQALFDDGDARRALEDNLEMFRSRLEQTLEECRSPYAALSDTVEQALGMTAAAPGEI